MTKRILTQDDLKSQLHYDPDTGIFTWLHNNSRIIAGSVAGVIDNGYIRIKINQKMYSAHRLAWLYMYGVIPNEYIDHINRNRCDNRIENIREATNSQNQMNTGIRCTNTSGFRGVTKLKNNWLAQATLNGKCIRIGTFNNPEDASLAYEKFIKEKHHFDFYINQQQFCVAQ